MDGHTRYWHCQKSSSISACRNSQQDTNKRCKRKRPAEL